MRKFGVALIGTGRHGARYARHVIDDLPELELVGIWRRDAVAAGRQASEFGCASFADYRDLIAARGVDIVVVVVPPALYPDIVATAASFGRAVLLEKPAAIHLDDGRRMQAAVRAAGIPLMVTQTLRYNGVVKALRAAIAEIGPLHALRISQRFEPSRPGWVDDPALSGGGVLMLTGIHSFDMARHLSGQEVDRVGCEVSMVGTTQRTEDNFSAVLRFADGRTLAAISGSRATASRTGAIELAGERGQLIGDHALNQAWIVRGAQATPIDVGPPLPTVLETLRGFVDALHGGAPMPITLEDGLRAVAIATACYEASRQQRTVVVAPVDEPGQAGAVSC